MKLIIDIPEEYKVLFDTERCKSKFDSLATNEFGYVLRKAFENGTPLDDVKEQMKKARRFHVGNFEDDNPIDYGIVEGFDKAIEILDNIGKAESEDKE